MTINERIRALRKELKLNQSEFGKKIGMKQTSISTMEGIGATVTDQAVAAICKIWSVNEVWLRTGDGDMFDTAKSDDLIAQLAERYELDYIGEEVLRTYLQMDNAGRAAISRFAMALTANVQQREDEMQSKADGSAPAPNRELGKAIV